MPEVNDINKLYRGRVYDGDSIERMIKKFGKIFRDNAQNNGRVNFVNDAAVNMAGNYLEQHLTFITPEILKQEYPEKPALSLFAVSNEGAIEKYIVNRMKTFQGKHKRGFEQKTQSKGVITIGYDAGAIRIEDFDAESNYKEIDLMRAAKYNEPLDSSLIEAHDESYKTIVDQIAWLGMQDEDGNALIEGLLNRSDVNVDIDLDSTDTFDNLDGVEMYNEIKKLYSAMRGKVAGVAALYPDTLVTSPGALNLIETTTYGTNSSDYQNPMTVAEMLKRNLGITELRATVRAEGLSAGTTDRLVLFNRQDKNMKLYIPQPLAFTDVFKKGRDYTLTSDFRAAGLRVNRELVFGYLNVVL